MKMKDDNVEAASNYVMQSDPTDLMLEVSDYKKKNEQVTEKLKNNEKVDDIAMLQQIDDLRRMFVLIFIYYIYVCNIFEHVLMSFEGW